MNVQRLAAFSEAGAGGNPAGVVLLDTLPPEADMQRVAAEVGYSETVFSAPDGDAWRTRYFAPEAEVPFCGHATIALGAALMKAHGAGEYRLILNDGDISVTASATGEIALVSPPTSYENATDEMVQEALALFGWNRSVLSDTYRPAITFAGEAKFLALPLARHEDLRSMAYDQAEGAAFMRANGFITLPLFWFERADLMHARNPFAGHGVYEDPATGASASAVAGYLRDAYGVTQPYEVLQGVDMGVPSRLHVAAQSETGAPIRVAGRTRPITG
ncbi:PhzF family phenazine biosynthesis protein [Litoreibacter meonggei]|uniref:PhzF family phenazine biosynthesis protein n=1 Tax=Litoreibacter meonggei TaxID=1049199 RepID=A0A497W518_9RHOB|nr:PhzF family phenazine biosynthesis protein [Litoreibacter meonggei]RLJ51541.1 PhzF family phenazine biosynthesis protein [Litoreibacter meonggei]